MRRGQDLQLGGFRDSRRTSGRGAGPAGTGPRGCGLGDREAEAGTACVWHVAPQSGVHPGEGLRLRLFPHCERERAPCTRGGRRPHVLVAARGTSFCKYHLSGEYGFRNANRAEVSKRFSGGEAPRAAEQRGVGAWGALSSAICCGLRRREGRPEGSGWTGNLG